MPPPHPFKVRELRVLRRGMRGKDVRWLHVLLNYHLAPPDNLLPIDGNGAEDFGPLTEKNVKKFQEINKIDFNTKNARNSSYMDGIVGPHTWAALHPITEVGSIIAVLPPVKPPGPLQLPEPQWPSVITPPKLVADGMLQAQMGETVSIPFKGKPDAGQQLQVGLLVLGKADGSTSQVAVGFVGSINIFRNDSNSTSSSGVFASWQTKNLLGSGDTFTWTTQLQEAIVKSVSGGRSFTTTGTVNANISLGKNKAGDDVVQITGQAGLFLEIDAPTKTNNDWSAVAGVSGFLGLTLSFYSYPSDNPLR
jgi:peptidoglycan hydrolase-like protein with peptidoglycan-binding domain